MAALRGHAAVPINQSSSNPPTCFGLPGLGGVKASWSNCAFTVHVAVYDDLNVYVGLNGAITDTVIASNYPVRMCVSPHDWDWHYTGTELVGPASAWNATIDANNRNFRWAFSCGDPAADNASGAGPGYIHVGKLTDFGGSESNQDGYLFVGGTGSYTVNDPIYPDPVRVTVPGFLRYLDYFPGARRIGSDWKSCNRSGGYLQKHAGGWVNRKNVAAGSGSNTVFVYKDGWKTAPEIGSK